ncbi:MAG: dihydrolipoyl dehydrogenase family protein [Candidatus Dormibacteria bacterium]
MSEQFDLVVIGGGTAGLSAAQAAVAQRSSVLLVSLGPLGGECTWNGCVPSKALIEAARAADTARNAARFGIRATEVSVDFPAVMARVRTVVEAIAGYEDEAHLEKSGVIVRRGQAHLVDAHTVAIDGQNVSAGAVVICTGSRPAVPPIPGLAEVPYLTNETVFDLREQPQRLLVIGAGPIGLELAQAFTRLGTAVQVLDAVDELLPREDPDIAAAARTMLETDGVEFMLGVAIAHAEHGSDGFRLRVRRGEIDHDLRGDALLVATGRRPNIDTIGLDGVGIKVTKKGITVNEHLRTNISGVYAAGDVTGILPFTHVAAYQGRLAAGNALGKKRSASYRVVPWITFTDPEIAHLGMTEPEARKEHGDSVRVATLPFTAIDRAVIAGQPRGLIKLITSGKPIIGHAGGGTILGAHILGMGAGELIHEFVIGMQVHAFAGRLAQAIHAYPALSVGVQQAVAQLFADGRATAGENREELVSLEDSVQTPND